MIPSNSPLSVDMNARVETTLGTTHFLVMSKVSILGRMSWRAQWLVAQLLTEPLTLDTVHSWQ